MFRLPSYPNDSDLFMPIMNKIVQYIVHCSTPCKLLYPLLYDIMYTYKHILVHTIAPLAYVNGSFIKACSFFMKRKTYHTPIYTSKHKIKLQ